jgi:hypothetical protein
MADPEHQFPHPDELLDDSTLRLLRRDFYELVAGGVLPDTPEAAEDFIGGYLWYEGLREQPAPADDRVLLFRASRKNAT